MRKISKYVPILVIALIASGCSHKTSLSAGSSIATTATTNLIHQTSSSSSTQVSTTSTTSAKSSGCSMALMNFQVLNPDAVAGSALETVEITNPTSAPCQLEGYPDITLEDSAANPISVKFSDGNVPSANYPVTSISLVPGAVAAFKIYYSLVPLGNGSCGNSYYAVLSTAQNQAQKTIKLSITVCSGEPISVSPFYSVTPSAG